MLIRKGSLGLAGVLAAVAAGALLFVLMQPAVTSTSRGQGGSSGIDVTLFLYDGSVISGELTGVTGGELLIDGIPYPMTEVALIASREANLLAGSQLISLPRAPQPQILSDIITWDQEIWSSREPRQIFLTVTLVSMVIDSPSDYVLVHVYLGDEEVSTYQLGYPVGAGQTITYSGLATRVVIDDFGRDEEAVVSYTLQVY